MHEDFDKEMAGSVVDTAAIHGLREEMELEFAIFKDQVHTHGSVNGELRDKKQKNLKKTVFIVSVCMICFVCKSFTKI